MTLLPACLSLPAMSTFQPSGLGSPRSLRPLAMTAWGSGSAPFSLLSSRAEGEAIHAETAYCTVRRAALTAALPSEKVTP